MNQPLLTIAIPTYNRALQLQNCLDSLESQMYKYNDCNNNVEIMISDNASEDNTKVIVNAYKEKMQLNYFRNKTNIGADRNFYQCYRKAKGKYIILLSDDDLLMEGALVKILRVLQNNADLDIIHLNTCSFEMNNQEILFGKSRLALKEDLILFDKNQFLETINIWITYCSGMIVRKDAMLTCKSVEHFFDTYFWQSYIFMYVIAKANKMFIMGEPCIGVRSADNTGNYNFYEVWIKNYKKLIITYGIECGFDLKTLKKIYIDTSSKSIKESIVAYGVNNKMTFSDRKILIKNTFVYPKLWVLLYPFCIFPNSVIQKLKKVIHKL